MQFNGLYEGLVVYVWAESIWGGMEFQPILVQLAVWSGLGWLVCRKTARNDVALIYRECVDMAAADNAGVGHQCSQLQSTSCFCLMVPVLPSVTAPTPNGRWMSGSSVTMPPVE